MKDYFRTMAIGTTRVYAKVDGPLTFDSYNASLRAGRSFVSTGPMLDFTVGGAGPGGVVSGRRATWSLDVHSAVPYDRVELLVNGSVVWTGEGAASPGTRRHTGTVELPSGGWVAVRAWSDGAVEWPAMNTIAFAHTSPVWVGSVGSTDPAARRAAAADLLRALANARQRVEIGYPEEAVPLVRERFERARMELERMAR
jgi:TolB protein